MNLDQVASLIFSHRLKCISDMGKKPDVIQNEQFKNLITAAKDTEWGRKYDYASICTYMDYASRVPIQSYDDIKPWIKRMMQGENNILWPEKIRWFARSSGTTSDKSKFIPVSKTSLRECHYRGAMDTVACYLNNTPGSRLFSGKGLILGGSHKPVLYNQYVEAGDLSAVLIENIYPLANFFRTPSKAIILMDEWEKKLELICRKTTHQNITNLSGVPSWFLVLIKKILKESGKQYLTEVWPNLEVFFHGGVSFVPYREQYESIIPSSRMRYMETYNASEGFFALQNDLSDPSMLLLLDYGIFYEFIPLEGLNYEQSKTCRLEEVEVNRDYALVISTNNGLWRYTIGDTVRFTSIRPYKIVITGRTRHYINAFGEEIIIDNAEKALLEACKATGAIVREYTVAPVYMSCQTKGRHQWLIEFEHSPSTLETFTTVLDQSLQELNSDYEAKRYKNMTLDRPEITVARHNLFYDWLKMEGKLGGQHKVPRLSNTREYIDPILSFQ